MVRKGTPRRGKVRAVLAGGVVLGVGSIATLAAWTDTEWVWGGGQGDGDNLGTSTFEMEQNATGDPGDWVQAEDSPGNKLRFSVDATNLAPGDTVYAPLQLRVVAGSDGGLVTLVGAQAVGDTDPLLFAALEYEVRTGVPLADCNAAGLADTGTVLVPPGSPLSTGSDANAFELDAAPSESTPGEIVELCFAVTLPEDERDNQDLQGAIAQPAWAFEAISS